MGRVIGLLIGLLLGVTCMAEVERSAPGEAMPNESASGRASGAPDVSQQATARKGTSQKASAQKAPAQKAQNAAALYKVQDGTRVDAKTLMGWKTWRALACERCHGAEQEGLVGPSLIESMKNLSKEDFHTTLMTGRLDKGMPPFNTSEMVTANWEGLYAYLMGRADGKIQPGRLTGLDQK